MLDETYREREIKTRVKGMSFDQLTFLISNLYDNNIKFHRKTTWTDYYFKADNCDFIRLRHEKAPGRNLEITLKKSDKGHNRDRVEINVDVLDVNAAKKFLTTLYGDPIETLERYADVYIMDDFLIGITNNSEPILEVESLGLDDFSLKKVVRSIEYFVNEYAATLEIEPRSMFELLQESKDKVNL